MSPLRERSRLALLVLAIAVAGGCKKKSTSAASEVTGLAAVPASAEVVIGADVARVMSSPLVARAIDQLLSRDADLAARWDKLRATCKLEPKQIRSIVLAIGPRGANQQPGTGPVLLVATGQLSETELASCVRSMVGQGGGQLTAKELGARTLYVAKDGNRTMYFAFGRADTVVLGSDEAFVTEALTGTKKVLDNPEMKKWIDLADTRQPMWAAGRVDERVRQGLVKVTSGQVSAGPTAIIMDGDLGNGMKLVARLVMASPKDAKALESFLKTNLGMLGMAAQAKSVGKVVDKIHVGSDNDTVKLDIDLGLDDVNQLLSALDGGGSAAQDAAPAPGSGSSATP